MQQEELWAGPELKLEYAHFHYIVMTQSIAFPHWRDDEIAQMATGTIIEHRTGVAPVEVTINSLFGVTYVGGPTKRVPLSETRTLPDPDLQWMARPVPVPQPHWEDFKVDGQPLFQEVQEYLTAASTRVSEGRNLSKLIHGTNSVTSPPP